MTPCAELRAEVVGGLRAGHSPDQVAGRLRYEHPGQQARWVSHESIYTWIYALPKGELASEGILLRSQRTQRRARGRTRSPGARIVGMTSIDARPAEVTDRAVPGHWEGDLVIGKAGKSAMATLVERTSRYTLPVALPAGRRDATTTRDALITTVTGMPTALIKTLTWDQGSEMAAHAAFSLATEVAVYFAHPTHPGSAAPTKTPTACSASTSPRAPRSPTTKPTSTTSPPNSTTGHAVSSATEPQRKSSPTSSQDQLLPPADTKHQEATVHDPQGTARAAVRWLRRAGVANRL